MSRLVFAHARVESECVHFVRVRRRIFAWQGLQKQKPLCQVASVTVSRGIS